MKEVNQIPNLKSESLESTNSELFHLRGHLNIGFDGKRAAGNFTGLGNYSRYLMKILAIHFPTNRYYIYSPKKFEKNLFQYPVIPASVSFRYPAKNILKNWWRSTGILKDLQKDKIQIYHGLSNEIPFGLKKKKIHSVVTIHDLIFLRFPEYYPLFDRIIYRIKVRYACNNADKIIAISQQTKRDIIHYLKVPEYRIKVIYQNCSDIFRKPLSDLILNDITKKYHLPDHYILSVGTIESRKNLMLIVRAMLHLNSKIDLIVIGKETAYAQKVKRFIAENALIDRIHFLKNVTPEDLPGIYMQAEIFVFPSRFEGFGIPIIEALHCGVPVIAASGSCLEEAGGPESLYVKPDDEKEMANAINLILNDPIKKNKMIKAGKEYVKRFSDEIVAAEIMDVYHKLIEPNA